MSRELEQMRTDQSVLRASGNNSAYSQVSVCWYCCCYPFGPAARFLAQKSPQLPLQRALCPGSSVSALPGSHSQLLQKVRAGGGVEGGSVRGRPGWGNRSRKLRWGWSIPALGGQGNLGSPPHQFQPEQAAFGIHSLRWRHRGRKPRAKPHP